MINSIQERMAILKQIADFPRLGEDPRLKNLLKEAEKALPDSEKDFVKHLIQEAQEKCGHTTDPLFIALNSIYGMFKKVCPLCGKTLEDAIQLNSL